MGETAEEPAVDGDGGGLEDRRWRCSQLSAPKIPLWAGISALVLVAVLCAVIPITAVSQTKIRRLAGEARSVAENLGDSWVESVAALAADIQSVKRLGEVFAADQTMSATLRLYEATTGLMNAASEEARTQHVTLRSLGVELNGRPYSFNVHGREHSSAGLSDVLVFLLRWHDTMNVNKGLSYMGWYDVRGNVAWVRKAAEGAFTRCEDTAIVGRNCSLCPHCDQLADDLVLEVHVRHPPNGTSPYSIHAWESGGLLERWGRGRNGSVVFLNSEPSTYDPRARPFFWSGLNAKGVPVATNMYLWVSNSLDSFDNIGTSLVVGHWVCADDALDELRGNGTTCAEAVASRGCDGDVAGLAEFYGAYDDRPGLASQWRQPLPTRVAEVCPETCRTCAEHGDPHSQCSAGSAMPPEVCGVYVGTQSTDLAVSDLSRIVAGTKIRSSGYAIVVELNRGESDLENFFTLIAHPNGSQTLTWVDPGDHSQGVEMVRQGSIRDPVAKQLLAAVWDRYEALLKNESVSRRHVYVDLTFDVEVDGGVRTYIAGVASMAAHLNDWLILTMTPLDEFTGDVEHLVKLSVSTQALASEQAAAATAEARSYASDVESGARTEALIISAAVLVASCVGSMCFVYFSVLPLRELRELMAAATTMELGSVQMGESLFSDVASMQESLQSLIDALADYRAYLPDHLLGDRGTSVILGDHDDAITKRASTAVDADSSENSSAQNTGSSQHAVGRSAIGRRMAMGLHPHRDAVCLSLRRPEVDAEPLGDWAAQLMTLGCNAATLEILSGEVALFTIGAGGVPCAPDEARVRACRMALQQAEESFSVSAGVSCGCIDAGNVGTAMRRQRVVEGPAVRAAHQLAVMAAGVPADVVASEQVALGLGQGPTTVSSQGGVPPPESPETIVCGSLTARPIDKLSALGVVYEVLPTGAPRANLNELWSLLSKGRTGDAKALVVELAASNRGDAGLAHLRRYVGEATETTVGGYCRNPPCACFGLSQARRVVSIGTRSESIASRASTSSVATTRMSDTMGAFPAQGIQLRPGVGASYLAVAFNITDEPEINVDRMTTFCREVGASGGRVETVSLHMFVARWDGTPPPLLQPTLCAARLFAAMDAGASFGLAHDGIEPSLRGPLPAVGGEVVLSPARARVEILALAARQERFPGLAEGCPSMHYWKWLVPHCMFGEGTSPVDGVSVLRDSSVQPTSPRAQEEELYASCVKALEDGDLRGARRALQRSMDIGDHSDTWGPRLAGGMAAAEDGGHDFRVKIGHEGFEFGDGDRLRKQGSAAGSGVKKRRSLLTEAVVRRAKEMAEMDSDSDDNLSVCSQRSSASLHQTPRTELSRRPTTEASSPRSLVSGPTEPQSLLKRRSLGAAAGEIARSVTAALEPSSPVGPSRFEVRKSLGVHIFKRDSQVSTSATRCPRPDFSPDGAAQFAAYWRIARLLALIYNCLFVPVLSVFGQTTVSDTTTVLFVVDTLADSVYWVDIALRFRATVEEDGVPVRDPAIIRKRYLRGPEQGCGVGWFAVDVLGCFPWEYAMLAYDAEFIVRNRWVRLNRLLNLLRFWTLVNGLRETFIPNVHPVKFTIVVLLMQLMFVLLWIGCLSVGVFFLSWGSSDSTHEYFDDSAFENGETLYKTLVAFHWALRGFAGYGQPWPMNGPQYGACLICNVIGIIMFASVIAYMQTLLGLLGSTYQDYVQSIDTLHFFFSYRKVPIRDRREVLRYSRALWHRTRQVTPGQYDFVHDELPLELSQELRFFSNVKIMNTVPELESRKEDMTFIVDVISRMQRLFLPPHAVLLERGGPASGIFFFYRGKAVVEIDTTEVCVLMDGDFWGEMASIFGTPEICSVRVVAFTEVYALSVESFEKIAEGFPKAASLFVDKAFRRRGAIRKMLTGTSKLDPGQKESNALQSEASRSWAPLVETRQSVSSPMGGSATVVARSPVHSQIGTPPLPGVQADDVLPRIPRVSPIQPAVSPPVGPHPVPAARVPGVVNPLHSPRRASLRRSPPGGDRSSFTDLNAVDGGDAPPAGRRRSRRTSHRSSVGRVQMSPEPE